MRWRFTYGVLYKHAFFGSEKTASLSNPMGTQTGPCGARLQTCPVWEVENPFLTSNFFLSRVSVEIAVFALSVGDRITTFGPGMTKKRQF